MEFVQSGAIRDYVTRMLSLGEPERRLISPNHD